MESSGTIFSYRQALDLLPAVRKITRETIDKIESLNHQIKSREDLEQKRTELSAATEAMLNDWQRQIRALGCYPKDLWLVDWDSGDGYYCWQYPEPTIGHHHGYVEGFSGRIPIQ